jgi:predicted transcriptional regulator
MPRTIEWPTREQWQEKAEQAERTSCFPRQRVSSAPADWLTTDEMDEACKLSAKLVRATRIALGKAGRTGERYDMNDWNRRALDEDADVDDVAGGWWQIARYARSVEVQPEFADRLTVLAESMRRARDEAAEESTEKAVAEAVARRATDAGWERELQRRARIEQGPQLTTITVYEDGSTTVSDPVPFRPNWPSY